MAVHPARSLPADRTTAELRIHAQRDNDLVWSDLQACGLERQGKQKRRWPHRGLLSAKTGRSLHDGLIGV